MIMDIEESAFYWNCFINNVTIDMCACNRKQCSVGGYLILLFEDLYYFFSVNRSFYEEN